MKALVTGGCGFVGRHLVLRLLKLGYEVHIVDNLWTGINPARWVPPEVFQQKQLTFFEMDVMEYFQPGPKLRFDDVFHLAAVVGGRVNIQKEPIVVARDIAIDAEFFNWVAHMNPTRVLYTSSSAAYPITYQAEGVAHALKESDIDFVGLLGQPDMTYGWAKLTGEYLANLTAKRYGISIACVRPFSGYGEDQEEAYPVPAIAARAAKKEDPLHVWGVGHQGRDFVHIEDCIDMFLIAIERIDDGSAVNIGSGEMTTFYRVAEIFAEIAGYGPEIIALKDKPMGVHSRYADITKAKSLEWSIKIPLEEGFRRVYESKLKAQGR